MDNIESSEACPVLNGFALFMDNIYTSYERSVIPEGEVKSSKEPLVTDLEEVSQVRGFVYTPKFEGEDGVIVDYQIEISNDGDDWTMISPVLTFNNIVNNPVAQEINFSEAVSTRYLRLVPLRVLTTTENVNTECQTYGVSIFGAIL